MSTTDKYAGGEESSPLFQAFPWKREDVATRENWDKIWAGCRAEPSKGLATSSAAEQQALEAFPAKGWALPFLPLWCPTCDAPWGLLRKLHCAIALWAQGIQSPRQLLGAATSTSTESQSRPILLFQPQARFDARGCKGSSYGFVLGLCQLSTDPHARTIIISFTDLLWQ